MCVCVCDPLQILPFPSQVVYNRVGKCGSRTVVILLKTLAEKHQFNLISSDIHNKTRLSKHEQVRPEGYCRVSKGPGGQDGDERGRLSVRIWCLS